MPSKIVCVGRNYREHAAELGNKMPDEPLLFLKAPQRLSEAVTRSSCLTNQVRLNMKGSSVVLGKTARKIRDEDPLSYVLGYGGERRYCPRSATQRCAIHSRQNPSTLFACRAFDRYRLGSKPANGYHPTEWNRETEWQHFRHGIPSALLDYISNIMTLNPGDLIATGTTGRCVRNERRRCRRS